MSTTTLAAPRTFADAARRRRLLRLLAVGGAVLAALAVWAGTTYGLGSELRAPAGGGRAASPIGAPQVVAAAAIASLAGWAALAVLERFTARARRLWVGLAVAVLVLSLGGPLSGSGVTVANRLVLVALHLVVAIVLVPSLHRTSPARPRAGS